MHTYTHKHAHISYEYIYTYTYRHRHTHTHSLHNNLGAGEGRRTARFEAYYSLSVTHCVSLMYQMEVTFFDEVGNMLVVSLI